MRSPGEIYQRRYDTHGLFDFQLCCYYELDHASVWLLFVFGLVLEDFNKSFGSSPVHLETYAAFADVLECTISYTLLFHFHFICIEAFYVLFQVVVSTASFNVSLIGAVDLGMIPRV